MEQWSNHILIQKAKILLRNSKMRKHLYFQAIIIIVPCHSDISKNTIKSNGRNILWDLSNMGLPNREILLHFVTVIQG